MAERNCESRYPWAACNSTPPNPARTLRSAAATKASATAAMSSMLRARGGSNWGLSSMKPEGATGCCPVKRAGARAPPCTSCTMPQQSAAAMAAAKGRRATSWASVATPSCPSKPLPSNEMKAAQVSTRPKPLRARAHNQRASSSYSKPSSPLCPLVSGANARRFFKLTPQRSFRGSRRCVTPDSSHRYRRCRSTHLDSYRGIAGGNLQQYKRRRQRSWGAAQSLSD